MAEKPSIVGSLTLRTAIVAVLAVLLIGGLWLQTEIHEYAEDAEHLEQNLIDEQKEQLRKVVHSAIALIDYGRASTEERVRQSLRDRVGNALSIAQSLYDQNVDRLSRTELEKLIRETLRTPRHDGGRGYFFAFDTQGIEQLFPLRPELEGQSMLSLKSAHGEMVVQDMLDLIAREGGGYYKYHWDKPGQEQADFEKLSYIQLFEPLGWVIGTGEYLDDATADTQQDVLARIEQIRFGNQGYVFVGTFDGISKTEPNKGKNVIDVTDVNGLKIVQNLIAIAQQGNGFLTYVIPAFGDRPSGPKISYVTGVTDWQWYVGAGTYIGDIERTSRQRKQELQERIMFNVLQTFGILFLFLLMIGWTVRRTRLKAERIHGRFADFFARAAQGTERIDADAMEFQEFQRLATSANQMIGARKQAEYNLRLTKFAVDHSADSVLWINDEGLVFALNEAGEKLFRATSETLMNLALADLIDLPDSQDWPAFWAHITQTDSATWEAFAHPATGDDIPVEAVANYLHFDGRQYVCAIVRDTSVRQQTERELKRKTMLLEKSNAELKQFAYVASHDLQEPLRMITSYLQLLDRKYGQDLNEDAHEMMSIAVDGASRMHRMINALLAYSRIERSMSKLGPVDMAVVVRDAQMNLEMSIHECGAELLIDPLPKVQGEHTQLVSLMQNLIGNAIKYRKPERTPVIQIGATRQGGLWEFHITDNGIGIERQYLERIFVIFQRLHQREDYEGTGIGLAICRRIVEHLGGRLWVESTPGQGSSFRFTLPAL
ncbi:hypothetical protein JCM17960_28800 [Magnetospira thiophila]